MARMYIILDALRKSAHTGIAARHTDGTARADNLMAGANKMGIFAICHHFISVIDRQQVTNDDKRCRRKVENAARCQKGTVSEVGKGRAAVHRGMSRGAINAAVGNDTATAHATAAATIHSGTTGIASVAVDKGA